MRGFVVVSGVPASGKTTVAAVLAKRLALPNFDKDAFLEALFLIEGVGTLDWRRELSRRADAQFQAQASSQGAAVLSSWWKHPASEADSGTPIGWLGASQIVAAEVYCKCSPSIAAERFLQRKRHPGHLDGRWPRESLVAMLEQQARLGPLFPTKAIVINTEHEVDFQDVVCRIKGCSSVGDA